MPQKPCPAWQRAALQFIKISIVVAALAYLIGSERLRWDYLQIKPGRAYLVAPAVLLLLASMVAAFARYRWLVRAVAIELGYGDSIRIGFIGAFFNTFLLGSVGGDVVRMAYVIRETGKRAAAVASVAMDRLIGLLGVICLAGAALLWCWPTVLATSSLHNLTLAIFGGLAAVALALICGLLALAYGRRPALALWMLLALGAVAFASFALRGDAVAVRAPALPEALLRGRALVVLAGDFLLALAAIAVLPSCQSGRRFHNFLRHAVPGGRALAALFESFLLYRGHLSALAMALIASIALQFLSLLGLYLFGLTLSVGQEPSLAQIFFAGPPTWIVNALPVPGGGLGVGEAAFDYLLSLCRDPLGNPLQGGAGIFLFYRFWTIVLSLLGGLPLYLKGKQEIILAEAELAKEE
ncbi:MAG: flippase-like domain-containing protein [Planctomycetota bacterium]|nr:flippase-like domain-containing protein [Planctomycetota bacterium]